MTTFILVLVGVILFLPIAQQVGSSTNTISVTDETHTMPANGGTITLTAYKSLSSFVAKNATGGETIAAGNYTVSNNQLVNGALAVQITVDDAEYASSDWNLSFVGEPTDYISSSGGRAMANLIPLLFALALAIVALYPTMKEKFF